MNQLMNKETLKRAAKSVLAAAFAVLLCCGLSFAADTADKSVLTNSLSKLQGIVEDIVTAVGVIMALFGVVQFGLSFQSHDPSQKAQGIMCFLGGVIIAIAPNLVTYLLG